MIISASCMSVTFKTHGYSWSEFLPSIFSLNLQMNFFTYASVLLILTQKDILSSSVSKILCFLMPIAFTVTSFLNSRSFSFGLNSALIVHSDSGFSRKENSLNQRVNLLTFVASKSLEPSSAGLSFDEMYLHCSIFYFSLIAWTLFATTILKHFTSFWCSPRWPSCLSKMSLHNLLYAAPFLLPWTF